MARTKRIDKSEFVVMGDEPNLKGKITRMQLCNALNWYNHFYSATVTKPRNPDCVGWIIEYMKSKKYTPAQIKAFSSLSDKEIPTTLCSMARMLNRGAIFENSLDERIHQLLENLKYKKPEAKVVKVEVKRPNPIVILFDSILDKFYDSNYRVMPDLTNVEIFGNKEEHAFASQLYSDLAEEVKGKDPEGYTHISALGLKRYRELLNNLNALLNKKKVRTKSGKPRKVRTPKKKSAQQLTALLKYKQAEKIGKDTFESVDPAKILESTVVWVYNSKKRLLTKYVSNTSPLTVKRTTLGNFDPKQSMAKKIRKPEIVIAQVATEGKASVARLFNNIKAKPQKVKGRMNDDSLIVRTFR